MTDLEHPHVSVFCFYAFDPGLSLGEAAPCLVCGAPAWCRDPRGRPRHRVDCLAVVLDDGGVS